VDRYTSWEPRWELVERGWVGENAPIRLLQVDVTGSLVVGGTEIIPQYADGLQLLQRTTYYYDPDRQTRKPEFRCEQYNSATPAPPTQLLCDPNTVGRVNENPMVWDAVNLTITAPLEAEIRSRRSPSNNQTLPQLLHFIIYAADLA
jgi:hypothetical protein